MNKRNYNPWVAKVEIESDEPVSHDQVEPNDPIDAEIEFDVGDIADFVAEKSLALPDVKPVIGSALYDFLYYLPDNIAKSIAGEYAENEDFKLWLCERKRG